MGVFKPDTETTTLRILFERGAMNEKQIDDALSVDQIDEAAVAKWAVEAAERGVIEPVPSSRAVRRWQITDQGRRAIGNEPAR